MTIDMVKGQKVDLTKGNPGLKNIAVGLGWDTPKYAGQANYDLDAAAFLLAAGDKAPSKTDLVYFNNLKHTSGSVIHTGDNLTGAGDGDDEVIKVDLSKIPANIEKILFVVNIYDAVNRNQNFGQVKNAFIRVVDADTNTEILKYDLSEDYSAFNAMLFGELYKHNGEWKFNAIGTGKNGNLATIGADYGL